jgi:uncharacterized coiled-coil protein SlyX
MGKKLKDLEVWEVSLVDKPANNKKFIVLKRAGNTPLIKSEEGGKLKALGGLWIKAEITDDEKWGLIQKGQISAFSWAGWPKKELIEYTDDGGYKVTLLETNVTEISIVTIPADPEAVFEIADEDNRIIEGWVSTDILNRNYFQIIPEAFEEGMELYINKPPNGTMFFNHDRDLPIGKVLKWEVVKSTNEGGEEENMVGFRARNKSKEPEVVEKVVNDPEEAPTTPISPEAPVKKDEEPVVDPQLTEKEIDTNALENELAEIKSSISALAASINALVEKLNDDSAKEAEVSEEPAATEKSGQPKDASLDALTKKVADLEKIIADNVPVRKGIVDNTKDRPTTAETTEREKILNDPTLHPGDKLRNFLAVSVNE